MPKALRLARAATRKVNAALAQLSPEERTRFETVKLAADQTRDLAHQMLDQQLDRIMPELLTHIDGGGTFGVFVIDPEHMPIMPQQSKLVSASGTPL